jgi:membrane protease YdiL (CAAX protease family)
MTKVINLSERPTGIQIFNQALSIILTGALINLFIGVIALLVGCAISGETFTQFQESILTSKDISYRTANAIKVVQFISMLGFLVTALVLPKLLYHTNPVRYTGLNSASSLSLYIISILVFAAFMPLLDLSNLLNMKMDLPAGLQSVENWMREKEDAAAQMTEKLITMPSASDFVFNALLIAVLPAICEEALFRGFLQRTFYRWWGRKHVAVFLSAFIFSAIHVQFFGFLPRFLLGLLLGYLFLWSGDLKLSIFIHFLNNFFSLSVAWFMQGDAENFDVNTPLANYPVILYFVSAVAGSVLLYLLYKRTRKRTAVSEVEEPVYRLPMSEVPWEKVYVTTRQYEAEIVAGKLEDAGIKTVIVNKQDSSYRVFGDIEVHVPRPFYQRAKEILG